MDAVADLVERYRASPRDRHWMVDELYLAFPDRRAVGAIIDGAADLGGDDGGRCAAFKVFHYVPPDCEADRARLLAVALATATGDSSGLVRDYAIAALGPFADRAEVEAILVPLLLDTGTNYNVRSAAFQTLNGRGHERRETLFRTLLDDPQLGREVGTHFARVAQRQKGRS